MNLFLIWTTAALYVLIGLVYAGTDHNPYTAAMSQHKWENIHGYAEVRPGVHLFYWFYYADGTAVAANMKPLVIWIQGGPGLAASGLGNFAEIGPFNVDMKPRNHTWVKGRNVLFIDHPVSTGFSYALNDSLLAKTDREVATDLSKAIKIFFRRYKKFRKTPSYLFSQSYGSKICPRLAFYLHTAIKKKSLHMNLRGLGIGSGWLNPKVTTLMQPEFLFHMGAIDWKLYQTAVPMAKNVSNYLENNDFKTASVYDNILFNYLNSEEDINFNKVNSPSSDPALQQLAVKVNKFVKPTLTEVNQLLDWNYLSYKAHSALQFQFLVPSTSFLERLLNTTDLKIAVYNGNMDVVTNMAGASLWVHKLKWPGADDFKETKRVAIPGHMNGFYKKTRQFSFWCVFRAGHWVPEDNPEAMEHILQHVMATDN